MPVPELKPEYFLESDPARPRNRADGGDWMMAIYFAQTFGIGVASFLIHLSALPESVGDLHQIERRLNDFCALILKGTFVCAPFVAVLGSIVFMQCLRRVRCGESWRSVVLWGCLLGCVLNFANLPCYWVGEMLNDAYAPSRIFKMIVLIAVAGAVSGIWIGCVAWRVVRPKEPWLPSFKLQSVLVLILIWGALMSLFAKR